jgi:hypothetical protein
MWVFRKGLGMQSLFSVVVPKDIDNSDLLLVSHIVASQIVRQWTNNNVRGWGYDFCVSQMD